MRKIYLLFVFLLSLSFTCNVEAKELIYYINKYDVGFSKEEYDFISNFYFEGYQDYMDIEDYNDFKASNIMNGEIQIINYPLINLQSEIYETQMKQLKVSSSCSTNCIVIWKQNPKIRSYDLIGMFFKNTSLIKKQQTYLLYNNTKVTPTETLENQSGISATIKLPATSEMMAITQQITVKKGGTINVSYQHARKNISLANSRKYSFSGNGYGGVFDFNDSVQDYYDAMNGLTIDV